MMLALIDADLRNRRIIGGLLAVERVLGNDVFQDQSLVALVGHLGVVEGGLIFVQLRDRVGEVGLRLVEGDLIGARIDFRAELAFFDLRIEVAQHLHDGPGDVGADLYRHYRIDGAGCGDGLHDIALGGRRGDILCAGGTAMEKVDATTAMIRTATTRNRTPIFRDRSVIGMRRL